MSIIKNHPIFEDNQVLTSGQLNQLHNYLDQQTRLTRSCLIGMGIACGLEIKTVTGNEPSITITGGLGISSEGYLIELCPEGNSCTTVQYRNYNLPEGVVYTPFQDEGFHQDIALFELLSSGAEYDQEEEVKPLSELPGGLEDKVVVLFLECIDNDLKSCLGKSCDELGIDRIFTLRKLLIDRDDLDKVNPRTNGERQDDLFPDKFIALPRVFFEGGDTVHYFPFAFRYVEALNTVFDPLKKYLSTTYTAYEPILGNVYGENPFETSVIQNVYKEIEEYLGGGLVKFPWLGIQYVYDFFDDLVLAYEEFRECAHDLIWQCCPDMTRFPRHLMLGEVIADPIGPCETDRYRHGFTQPPIYNKQQLLLEKTISLHKRIVLLLEKFSFESLNDPIELPVKATPGGGRKSSLSVQSIPFYYDSKGESSFWPSENLELEWNFSRKHRRCQLFEKEQNALNLSYDNNTMLPEAKTPLSTPLRFKMDRHNFLRIEGHQGKDIHDTVAGLTALKTKANIDFDIKGIYLGDLFPEDDKRVRLPECLYQDLQVDYSIWRGKLLYFLGSFSRLVTGSRFLQRKDTSANMNNYTSAHDTSALYKKLNNVDGLNRSLTKDNWMRVADEVHYKTKEDNKAEWIKKERETATATGTQKASVDDLHAAITECLKAIRNNTPEDLASFEMEPWLEAYRCPLVLFVEYLKLQSGQIPNDTNMTEVNLKIRLIAALQELVRNLFIYPYIDIRIINNALTGRMEQYREQHSFSNFLKNHTGLEHQAGVEQGQTFVLLYQGGYSDSTQEKLMKEAEIWLKDAGKIDVDLGDFFEWNKEVFGTVLADFTLPYKCCDPCVDVGSVEIPLDPLAVPICEIVPTRIVGEKQASIEYEPLEERILHSMYDPEAYRIDLKNTEGKYGQAKLNIRPFPFDEEKEVQTFLYTADTKKVLAASVNSQSAYLVDVFEYAISRVEGSGTEGQSQTVLVDSAEITVIVPIIPRGEAVVGIQGRIYYKDTKGRELPIPGAQVWTNVNKFEIHSQADERGGYSLVNDALVNGSYEVFATANGFYQGKASEVVVKNAMATRDIELIPRIDLKGGIKGLVEHLDLNENSREALLMAKEYENSRNLYKEVIASTILREKENVKTLIATEKTISKFNEEDDIPTEVLNKTYVAQRDALLKELATTKNKVTMANRAAALKVLTNSYMDRLILSEKGDFSAESLAVLKESSSKIGKAGINMKAEMKEWSESKTRVLGEDIVKAITKNFKA
ncbi:carboxypeptidase-like regulatory domain-containing protein [Pseudozobellia thermophila]|uniref:Carboxypeptidase regulatory-like domain-containing protein n=1 Tax=Pseudozobellia thermophila TaxID=192903 RepID=A0A1M6M6I1_9FLAO|nr:carboxypeptidase-like regulatory domain-containing protein [Pseudozobellia thermophila]SHJ78990.1 hypothetical protein SAMN04488513_1097 [Pseudozobellia thermophila]